MDSHLWFAVSQKQSTSLVAKVLVRAHSLMSRIVLQKSSFRGLDSQSLLCCVIRIVPSEPISGGPLLSFRNLKSNQILCFQKRCPQRRAVLERGLRPEKGTSRSSGTHIPQRLMLSQSRPFSSMTPWSASASLKRPSTSPTQVHAGLYPTLLALVPFVILSIIVRSIRPNEEQLFSPALNTTVYIDPLPQTFHHISAVHPLTSGLVVADHPTNSLFFIPRGGRLPHSFLSNAGGTNESHAVTLRRPGISAIAEYPYSQDIVLLIIARHAARDIAVLPITHDSLVPNSGEPITIAESFNGTRLNSPNSLHVDTEGNIFFSDAYFGLVEETDEFDRTLDNPPEKTHKQCVYYLPADEIQNAFEERRIIEPRLLVGGIDRPAGIAVYDGRLFLSVSSPRRPGVVEYRLEKQENIFRATNPVEVYQWTGALHSWGQRGFSGILGNLIVVNGTVFVAAGDGIAVIDGKLRNNVKKPLAWVGVNVQPGPPTMAFKDGWLFVGASGRAVKMKFG